MKKWLVIPLLLCLLCTRPASAQNAGAGLVDELVGLLAVGLATEFKRRHKEER